VTGTSLISDVLLSELMAVGEVDVLVGVPTLDHAATIGRVVHAIHGSFARHFLRQRTVLINCDAGSKDDTPALVREASLQAKETLVTSQSLRTMHRISTPYHGLPGKAGALRTLFVAAELLGARAIAVFDPDVTSITPEWVEALVRPVWDNRADFVAPVFPRHPLDGPLVTQLIRPLVGAAYGHRVREPLASEFACSLRFASACLSEDVWDGPLVRYGIDLWLTGTALAQGFRCAEAPLGPRVVVASGSRPPLAETFRQVVGALFDCLACHESYWTSRQGSEPLPVLGAPAPFAGEPAAMDPAPWAEAFRRGVRDLVPVLEPILSPSTLGRVVDLSRTDEAGPLPYPDDLWVSVVIEAAAAYRQDLMHREHIVQALVPLYLGRAASFLVENGASPVETVEARLESLRERYHSAKPELVRLWTARTGGTP
jgi:hypothetical protein